MKLETVSVKTEQKKKYSSNSLAQTHTHTRTQTISFYSFSRLEILLHGFQRKKNLNTIFFHLWLCVSNVIANWVSLSTNNDNRYVFLCNASHENKVKHQIKITRFQERNNNNVFKTKKQNKVFLMNYELFIYYFLCIFFLLSFLFLFPFFLLMVIFSVSFIWFLSFLSLCYPDAPIV